MDRIEEEDQEQEWGLPESSAETDEFWDPAAEPVFEEDPPPAELMAAEEPSWAEPAQEPASSSPQSEPLQPAPTLPPVLDMAAIAETLKPMIAQVIREELAKMSLPAVALAKPEAQLEALMSVQKAIEGAARIAKEEAVSMKRAADAMARKASAVRGLGFRMGLMWLVIGTLLGLLIAHGTLTQLSTQ
jgi:hypothetical protein